MKTSLRNTSRQRMQFGKPVRATAQNNFTSFATLKRDDPQIKARLDNLV